MDFKQIGALLLLCLLLMGPAGYAGDPQTSGDPSSATAGQWSDGWYQGGAGYDRAVEEYKRTHKPMVVYMNVGWCPYCRKFEKEVLSSPLVQEMLKDKIKVNINPESGRRENALAFQYGIRGFPSFFLHPPQPGSPVQLSTGVDPEQFVDFFRQVLK